LWTPEDAETPHMQSCRRDGQTNHSLTSRRDKVAAASVPVAAAPRGAVPASPACVRGLTTISGRPGSTATGVGGGSVLTVS